MSSAQSFQASLKRLVTAGLCHLPWAPEGWVQRKGKCIGNISQCCTRVLTIHLLLSCFCELNHGHSVSLSKPNLNNNENLTKQQNTELAMASLHNATVLKDHFGVEGDLKGCWRAMAIKQQVMCDWSQWTKDYFSWARVHWGAAEPTAPCGVHEVMGWNRNCLKTNWAGWTLSKEQTQKCDN